MNKKELLQKIKEVEGLSQDERAYLVNLVNTKKKYGLVWEDKPEDVEELLRTKLPVLKEVKDRAIINDDVQVSDSPPSGEPEGASPNHILIEGDNLHALTALTFTHENKIDLIYIDPPYNTGNKDFIYNDHYVDKEDAYRHSKWISFMEKRLKITHKLLKEDGVIFISIDDNEFAQLKMICDEIFGESNFITKFDWRKKTGANDAKAIAVITETVLLYSKNLSVTIDKNIWARDASSRNEKRFKKKDKYFERRGLYYLDTLDRGGLGYVESLDFGIKAPNGKLIYPNNRKEKFNDGWRWKWGKEKVAWGLDNDFFEFVKDSKKLAGYSVKLKNYQFVDNKNKIRNQIGRAYSNLITDPINQQGNSDISSVFDGKSPFSNPKPIGLIKYLINCINKKDYSILDFFAGSGTTLHSLINLNAEDGGSRKGILVTNNENNIAEEVTYERNKRVINGYTNAKGEQIEGLKNNNLRYYKTDFVDRKPSLQNKRQLTQLATELLCIKEDAYTAVSLTLDNIKWCKSFTDQKGKLLFVVYDDMYIEEAVNMLEESIKENKYKEVKVYVFSNGQYAYAEEFEDIAENITLAALPDAIYKAYQNVLPKENKEFVPELNEDIIVDTQDQTKLNL